MASDSRPPGDSGEPGVPFRASRRPRLRGPSGDPGPNRDAPSGVENSPGDAARRQDNPPAQPPEGERRRRFRGEEPDRGTGDAPRRPRVPRKDDGQGAGATPTESRRAERPRISHAEPASSGDNLAKPARPDQPPAGRRAAGAAAGGAAGAVAAKANTTSAPKTSERSPATDGRRTRRPASTDAATPRHPRGDGADFSRLVRWTSLGTLLPGVGLIRAGRKIGWLFLLLFVGAIVAAFVAAAVMGPVAFAAQLATNPQILLVGAIALAVVGLLWVFVVLGTYSAWRRRMRLQGAQRPLAAILVTSLVVIVGVPFGVSSAYSLVQRNTVSALFANTGGGTKSTASMWKDKPRVNVFLIGRDNGEDREGTRPDTMLVASIDTKTGASTLISVPRNLAFPQFPEGSDLAKQFPSGFDAFGPEESLINAVWTWAEDNPDPVKAPQGIEPGLSATMQAVEGSLGLSIDYFTAVDFKGFEDLVNSMGGVKMDVERPIPMGGGTNMMTGAKNRIFDWIDPGEQTLDGKNALWYVRSREGSDNYDRMCRQQRMIKTTLGQIDPTELALAYPKLAGSASKNIQTDIPQNEVSAFVELAVEMQRQPVKSAQITNDVVQTANPDYDELRTWAKEQVDPQKDSQAEKAGGADKVPAGESAAPTEDEPALSEATEDSAGASTAKPKETEPPSGVENADGKCFPKGYNPDAPIPGYNR